MAKSPDGSAALARRPWNPYQVARWALDVALIGLILIALAGAVLGRLVPLTGRETLIIGGASMEPQIALGAAVVIEPVAADQIAVGDVVSLRSGEGLKSIFTHRVTRVIHRADGIWVETKGDANSIIDASITPAANVMGRVVLNVPFGGFLLKLLSMPSGVALIICLAGALVAATWLVETMEGERRRWPRPGARPVAGGIGGGIAAPGERGADAVLRPRPRRPPEHRRPTSASASVTATATPGGDEP
jgi:signal peptidase